MLSRDQMLHHITQATVRDALSSLLYCSNAPQASPLQNLLLVNQRLAPSDMIFDPDSRDFALRLLLVSVITDELAYRRRVLLLRPPEYEISLQAARQAITADGQTCNPELIAWSWLYHRYVRVDFDLSPAQFSQMIDVTPRTLQRYHQHGIRRLTERLIEMEAVARSEKHDRHLYTRLPSVTPVHLYGRQKALTQAQDLLKHSLPYHLQVTGAAGVGKTAFVQELVRWMIAQQFVDNLLWINQPASAYDIQEYLEEALGFPYTAARIREHMASVRFVLVADGADRLYGNSLALEVLLADLGNAVVYLTSRAILPLSSATAHIALAELGSSDALALIRALSSKHYSEENSGISNEEAFVVWERVGGNPRAIQREISA
jgi:hypothetical protein